MTRDADLDRLPERTKSSQIDRLPAPAESQSQAVSTSVNGAISPFIFEYIDSSQSAIVPIELSVWSVAPIRDPERG